MRMTGHIGLSALVFTFIFLSCKSTRGSKPLTLEELKLGMNVQPFDAIESSKWSTRMGLKLGDESKGLTVREVKQAMFGSVIGIKSGDLILALNDRVVATSSDFQTIANRIAGFEGRSSKFTGWVFRLQRGSQTLDLSAKPEFECDPYALVGCGPLAGPD